MKKGWRPLIFVLCCYAGAIGLWYYYFTFRPVTEADFSTVTGTLKSAQENVSYKQSYFEFTLSKALFAFVFQLTGMRKNFNRAAFFANVMPGTKITIKVEKAQLAKPARPFRDSIDTVFVYGLMDDKMAYCSHVVRNDWEEMNQITYSILAVVLSLFAIGMTVVYVRAPNKTL